MSEHTKEPWHLGEIRSIRGRIYTTMPDGDEYVLADTNWNFPDDAKANARRIVACVNACEGISTEELENRLSVQSLQNFAANKMASCEQILVALENLCAVLPKDPEALAHYHASYELVAARDMAQQFRESLFKEVLE